MYVCLCRGITEGRVKQMGRDGVLCPKVLACALGIDEPGCCGRCLKNIEELVTIAASEIPATSPH
jgi:bacterioferritin-associated ferredoxin